MKILGFDTATEACACALSIQADPASPISLTQRFKHAPNKQSELLLPQIRSLLEDAGIQLSDLDAIAFGCGPGSFTGVRLGVSIVQGLGMGSGVSVVPVSTLAALAWSAMQKHDLDRVTAALDARMDELYWGVYQRTEQGIETLVDASVSAAESIPVEYLQSSVGAGNGWDRYHERLQALTQHKLDWVTEQQVQGAAITELGAIAYHAGQAIDAAEATPIYVRNQVVRAPA